MELFHIQEATKDFINSLLGFLKGEFEFLEVE